MVPRIQRASIFPLYHPQAMDLSFWHGLPHGVKMFAAARQGPALCCFLGTKKTSGASYQRSLNVFLARIMSLAHAPASRMTQRMRLRWILRPVKDLPLGRVEKAPAQSWVKSEESHGFLARRGRRSGSSLVSFIFPGHSLCLVHSRHLVIIC